MSNAARSARPHEVEALEAAVLNGGPDVLVDAAACRRALTPLLPRQAALVDAVAAAAGAGLPAALARQQNDVDRDAVLERAVATVTDSGRDAATARRAVGAWGARQERLDGAAFLRDLAAPTLLPPAPVAAPLAVQRLDTAADRARAVLATDTVVLRAGLAGLGVLAVVVLAAASVADRAVDARDAGATRPVSASAVPYYGAGSPQPALVTPSASTDGVGSSILTAAQATGPVPIGALVRSADVAAAGRPVVSSRTITAPVVGTVDPVVPVTVTAPAPTASGAPRPLPSPVPDPTPTSSRTLSPTPSVSPTATGTPGPTQSPVPTASLAPTGSPVPTSSVPASPVPTSPAATAAPTRTPTGAPVPPPSSSAPAPSASTAPSSAVPSGGTTTPPAASRSPKPKPTP